MSETSKLNDERPSWVKWAHVAAISYPVAIWAIVVGVIAGGTIAEGLLIVGLVALSAGTIAAIGWAGRYLSTRR